MAQPQSAGRAWPGVRDLAWLLHGIGLAVLVLLAGAGAVTVESPGRGFRSSAVLVAPPVEFTQTAPNRAKIGKEFSLDNLMPRPALRVPPAIPHLAPARSCCAARTAQSAPAGRERAAPPAPQLGSTQMPGPPPQTPDRGAAQARVSRRRACRPALRGRRPGLGRPKTPGEVIAEAPRRPAPHAGGRRSGERLRSAAGPRARKRTPAGARRLAGAPPLSSC